MISPRPPKPCTAPFLAVFFAAFLLSACGSGNSTVESASVQAEISGRWANTPVPLYVSAEIAADEEMMNDVRAAAAFWEEAAQKSLFDFKEDWQGPTPPISGTYTEPSDISANLIFFVDPWPMSSSVKGHTILKKQSDAFQHGVIYLKHENYCIGACEGPSGQLSFRRLIAHELGHYLGLKHTTDPLDIMFPTIPVGQPLSMATYPHPALQSLVQ